MLTDAYNLPSKKVIHIVGPIVYGELTKELEKELADCYEKTLDMCLENGLKSVAFCCISTGEFRFPKERAAEIAIETTKKWALEHPFAMDRIIFNVFNVIPWDNYIAVQENQPAVFSSFCSVISAEPWP